MTSVVAGSIGVAVAGLYMWLRTKSDDVPTDLANVVRLLGLKRHIMVCCIAVSVVVSVVAVVTVIVERYCT
jgi:hypothetical protein